MANLPEASEREDGIYQLEPTDPVLGGVGGIANIQATQLGNRTAYLKQRVDDLETEINAIKEQLQSLITTGD